MLYKTQYQEYHIIYRFFYIIIFITVQLIKKFSHLSITLYNDKQCVLAGCSVGCKKMSRSEEKLEIIPHINWASNVDTKNKLFTEKISAGIFLEFNLMIIWIITIDGNTSIIIKLTNLLSPYTIIQCVLVGQFVGWLVSLLVNWSVV